MAINTFDILPAQSEPTDGWTIDYSFLNEVRNVAYRDYDEDVSLEGVEAVLLAVRTTLDGVIDTIASERDAAIARADAAGVYIERIRTALGGYEDSDLASLAETLRRRNEALEAEAEQMRTALRVAEQLTLRELQKSIAWRD